jgi:hypothetical protein
MSAGAAPQRLRAPRGGAFNNRELAIVQRIQALEPRLGSCCAPAAQPPRFCATSACAPKAARLLELQLEMSSVEMHDAQSSAPAGSQLAHAPGQRGVNASSARAREIAPKARSCPAAAPIWATRPTPAAPIRCPVAPATCSTAAPPPLWPDSRSSRRWSPSPARRLPGACSSRPPTRLRSLPRARPSPASPSPPMSPATRCSRLTRAPSRRCAARLLPTPSLQLASSRAAGGGVANPCRIAHLPRAWNQTPTPRLNRAGLRRRQVRGGAVHLRHRPPRPQVGRHAAHPQGRVHRHLQHQLRRHLRRQHRLPRQPLDRRPDPGRRRQAGALRLRRRRRPGDQEERRHPRAAQVCDARARLHPHRPQDQEHQ